jgi:protein phosphatase
LLRPKTWRQPAPKSRFFLSVDEIFELCTLAEGVFSTENTVLRLRAPVKVFGDLHGQFGDLMRLFQAFGEPSRELNGDLALVDYLFLGDYVDRGENSLETICLLLALKIENPKNIHLIRGNHESDMVNCMMGFFAECLERMGFDDGRKTWVRINDVFDWLPLAAIVQERILCIHGGIGKNIRSIADIEAFHRPLQALEGGEALTDVLWSDPTEHDSILGVHENAKRGVGVYSFGPDCVREFCDSNGLAMIIRGHECVLDGVERFAGGHGLTVFSATNYCGARNIVHFIKLESLNELVVFMMVGYFICERR